MQTRFKRHEGVVLLVDPDPEYIEYVPGKEGTPIKKGDKGKVNVILPNGKYHVEIINSKGEQVAYVPMDEDQLDSA